MNAMPYLVIGVRANRTAATALLLLTLLGVTSCDGPAAPTRCEAACSEASKSCIWLGTGPPPSAGCDWAYSQCIEKCR